MLTSSDKSILKFSMPTIGIGWFLIRFTMYDELVKYTLRSASDNSFIFNYIQANVIYLILMTLLLSLTLYTQLYYRNMKDKSRREIIGDILFCVMMMTLFILLCLIVWSMVVKFLIEPITGGCEDIRWLAEPLSLVSLYIMYRAIVWIDGEFNFK